MLAMSPSTCTEQLSQMSKVGGTIVNVQARDGPKVSSEVERHRTTIPN